MDTLPVFRIIFAVILALEGALASVLDACRGHCDNHAGTFCEPFIGTCEPCQRCRTEDGNGCRAVCDAWKALKTTTSSTAWISTTTPSFLAQSTMSEQMDANSASTSGSHSNTGTSVVITEELGLWLGILAAGLVLMIAFYCYCQQRKKRKRNRRDQGDIEIALNEIGCVQQQQQQGDQQGEQVEVQEENSLLLNRDCSGHGSQCTIPVSVPAKKVDNEYECPGKQLLSQEVIGAEAPESGYKSAVSGMATEQDQSSFPSQGSMSFARALRSTDQPGLEYELHRGAVPTVNPVDRTALHRGAVSSVNPVDGTALSLTVQDGTHDKHEFAV